MLNSGDCSSRANSVGFQFFKGHAAERNALNSAPSLFWDQLIQLIDEGKVVPVVGQDVLTLPESSGHTLLYPCLALRLAAYLGVSTEDLPLGAELNEVAYRFLSKRNPSQQIYAALKTVVNQAEVLPIPEPLLKLAEITPFRLFVSTTFDSSLARALNQVRFANAAKTRTFTYSPNEMQDLPANIAALGDPIVYQLLGKVSATPSYAVTQEDLIEFFHSLQSETRRPAQLFHELSNSNLLMLGTRLSGWLTSFLMRMSKRQRLSIDDKTDYVADETVTNDRDLVLFLERFSSATQIFREKKPIEFIDELHRRWKAAHPTSAGNELQPAQSMPLTEAGAVFLSYASEDLTAAIAIKTALETAGVDVFFDKEQLQAGNDWDGKLRRVIHQCSLFIPVISNQTLTHEHRFFRVEWNLALEEAKMVSFSSEAAFLIPVIIDSTPIGHAALPAKFSDVQSASLPGGMPTPGFVGRVKTLYRQHQLARVGA
jgi:hypothetical protein